MSQAITAQNAAATDTFEPADYDFEVNMGELGSASSDRIVDQQPPQVAPQVGEPKGEVEPPIPDKFQGKPLEEVYRSYEEAQKAMTRAQQEAAEARRELQNTRSQYELDKMKYDAMIAQKQQTNVGVDDIDKKFLSKVNEDPEVLQVIRALAREEASRITGQTVNPVLNEATQLRSQIYNITANEFIRSNKVSADEFQDAAKVGEQVGNIFVKHLYASGLDEATVAKVFNSVTYDPSLLPFMVQAAKGLRSGGQKAPVVQPNPQVLESKKEQMASVGNSSSSSDSGLPPIHEFNKLSPSEQESLLKKHGLL